MAVASFFTRRLGISNLANLADMSFTWGGRVTFRASFRGCLRKTDLKTYGDTGTREGRALNAATFILQMEMRLVLAEGGDGLGA